MKFTIKKYPNQSDIHKTILSAPEICIYFFDRRAYKRFWTHEWNYKYGNCFTFNSGVDENGKPLTVLQTTRPGPSSGKKILFVQLNISIKIRKNDSKRQILSDFIVKL